MTTRQTTSKTTEQITKLTSATAAGVTATATAKDISIPSGSRKWSITLAAGDSVYAKWKIPGDSADATSSNAMLLLEGSEVLAIPSTATAVSIIRGGGNDVTFLSSFSAGEVFLGGNQKQIDWLNTSHNSQIEAFNALPTLSAPYGWMALVRINDISATQRIATLGSGAAGDELLVQVLSNPFIQLQIKATGGTTRSINHSTAPVAGTWYYICAEYNSTIDRALRVDGTRDTQTSDNVADMTGVDSFQLAESPANTNDADITVAWCGVFDTAAPTDAEWTDIRNGVWPPKAFANFVEFWPMLGSNKTEAYQGLCNWVDLAPRISSSEAEVLEAMAATETLERPNSYFTVPTDGDVQNVSYTGGAGSGTFTVPHHGYVRVSCTHNIRIRFGDSAGNATPTADADPTDATGQVFIPKNTPTVVKAGLLSTNVGVQCRNDADTANDSQIGKVNLTSVQRNLNLSISMTSVGGVTT